MSDETSGRAREVVRQWAHGGARYDSVLEKAISAALTAEREATLAEACERVEALWTERCLVSIVPDNVLTHILAAVKGDDRD